MFLYYSKCIFVQTTIPDFYSLSQCCSTRNGKATTGKSKHDMEVDSAGKEIGKPIPSHD